MLSIPTENSASSRADFYSWDGSFLRSFDVASGAVLSSVDGAYVVNATTGDISSSTGALVGSIDIFGSGFNGTQGRLAFNWAADGDYFCTLETIGTRFALLVEDIAGHVQQIPLDVPSDLVPTDGILSMLVGCSLTANRAAVLSDDQPRKVVLFSLPDGNAVSAFTLNNFVASAWSAGLQWLMAYTDDATGPHAEVIDATTGTIASRLDGYFNSFTPNGNNVVGTDSQGHATLLDWRTKNHLWNDPAELDGVLAADPSTSKMLLRLVTGSPIAGTATYSYWIVDGDGSGFKFTPRNCAPTAASASRMCVVI